MAQYVSTVKIVFSMEIPNGRDYLLGHDYLLGSFSPGHPDRIDILHPQLVVKGCLNPVSDLNRVSL